MKQSTIKLEGHIDFRNFISGGVWQYHQLFCCPQASQFILTNILCTSQKYVFIHRLPCHSPNVFLIYYLLSKILMLSQTSNWIIFSVSTIRNLRPGLVHTCAYTSDVILGTTPAYINIKFMHSRMSDLCQNEITMHTVLPWKSESF